jgi:hypothetical protein
MWCRLRGSRGEGVCHRVREKKGVAEAMEVPIDYRAKVEEYVAELMGGEGSDVTRDTVGGRR